MKADIVVNTIMRLYNTIVVSDKFSPFTIASFMEAKTEALETLNQLELKAEELDRRELGAKVTVYGVPPTRVQKCGHCERILPVTLKMGYYHYCSYCGTRLIHPELESETYTVQINGKDVVLKKGVDYEVIPKDEIFVI